MRPGEVGDNYAPIVRNWFDSAALKDRTDAFRRSQELWADRTSPNLPDEDEMYSAAQREIDLKIARQCFEGLHAVRRETPEFFQAFDYEWAFELNNYLTPIRGGTRVESQSLRGQVFLLQALSDAWKINAPQPKPLAYENICVRRVTDFDTVPRCVQDGQFRYVIISDEFRMQLLKLLGGLRTLSGSKADEQPKVAMERMCAPHVQSDFSNLPLMVLPRQIARVFRVAKRPWDLALMCMAEQTVEAAIPRFQKIYQGVFPPPAGSIELQLLDIITPFFLYHEAAHLLLQHPPERSAEKETAADSLGFALFFATRGWRDAVNSAVGFGEIENTLLGPMLFLWVVKCITRLEILTASKRQQDAASVFLDELDERRKNLAARATATVDLARKQVPNILSHESYERLVKLTQTLTSAAASFERSQLLSDIVSIATAALKTWEAGL